MNSISAILLNEHPIDGCIHDLNGVLRPFPILAIDGIPLNQWLDKNTHVFGEISTLTLVPAQGWLYDFNDEHALSNAWQLLKPESSEYGPVSTVVPLLVCPDDLDLVCSVLMVEQVVTQSEVRWIRFGQAYGDMSQIVTSVVWESLPTSAELVFSFTEFEQAYAQLKAFDAVWSA